MTELQTLTNWLHRMSVQPEEVRALVRQEESGLSEADSKLLTALRFVTQGLDGETGENLFFMSGLFKAGTTWLGLLLNAHPGLFCGATEIHSFSAQVSELYTNRRLNELPDSEAKVWGNNILEAKRAALFWQIVSSANKPSAKRLGGRGPVVNVRQLIRAYPRIKIPVILRDGRDIAVSAAFFHKKFYDQPYERFFEDEALTRINAEYAGGWAWQFKDFYSKALAARDEFPDNVIVVRYEDLLTDPVSHMSKVYAFLTVSNDPGTVQSAVDSCRFDKLSGGRKPGEADTQSFFRKGVAGDWQTYFTDAAVDKFKEIAGDFLIDSGYEKDGNWGVEKAEQI